MTDMLDLDRLEMTCPTCHGTGVHAYDDHHAKPCADCCRHSQGVWQLTEHYGDLNGRWCCLAGCGFTWASRAAYESWCWHPETETTLCGHTTCWTCGTEWTEAR